MELHNFLITRLGVCIQNKLNDTFACSISKYDTVLLTASYSAYTVYFFLGQFPKRKIMLLVLYILFSWLVNVILFLTGCVFALNYILEQARPSNILSYESSRYCKEHKSAYSCIQNILPASPGTCPGIPVTGSLWLTSRLPVFSSTLQEVSSNCIYSALNVTSTRLIVIMLQIQML